MLKDIDFPKIENVSVGIALNTTENQEQWTVFIINENDVPIENVMVVSKGYGEVEGEKIKTSTLRRFFESIPAKSTQQIEPIPEDLLGLANEYWVSFYINKKVFDKKFVFTAGAINKRFVTTLPILNQEGILHS